MIESLTIAGPLALVRSYTLPPAADLPKPALPEKLAAPDPDAPVGPKPTFTVTPMERLQETLRAMPASEADRAAPIPGETAAAPPVRSEPGIAFSEPRGDSQIDRRA